MKTLITILVAICLNFIANILHCQQIEINIISVNDTHSNLTPGGARDSELKGTIGGLARATSVIGEAMQQDSNTLLLHAGDFFIGDLWFYLNYGVLEIEWMKMMGFDAITLGNHEFDGTVDMITGVLAMGLPENEIPVLSANLEAKTEKGELLTSKVTPHIIKEINGIKIGIFGMTSPDANLTSLAAPDIFVASDDPQTTIMIAGGQVQALKEKGCDVVIFLSHLGIQYDRAIAANIPMIDLIIGAHDHLSLKKEEVIGNTRIIQSGAFFQQMGKTKLTIVDKQVTKIDYQLVDLDSSIPEEPVVAELLDSQIKGMDEITKSMFLQEIAVCKDEISEYIPNIFSNGSKTTGVGNLISNAFKYLGNTDIGFTTSGLSAQPLYKGSIVAQDVIKMLGYGLNETTGLGYDMVKFDIKGTDLLKGFEICFGAMAAFQNDEFLPQLAGVELRYNPNDFSKFEVKIDGKLIDTYKNYSITTSIFVATILSMNGIDLLNYESIEGASDILVVLNYIMNLKTLNNDFIPTVIADNTVNVDKEESNNLIKNKDNMKIYPNPAIDKINVDFSFINRGNYNVKVFNTSSLDIIDFGEFFVSEEQNQIIMNVSNLINGNYLVIVKGSNTYLSTFTVCR